MERTKICPSFACILLLLPVSNSLVIVFSLNLLLRRFLILFCAALPLASCALPVHAFDATVFWQEPNVPFDITPVDAGREYDNSGRGRLGPFTGQRNQNRP